MLEGIGNAVHLLAAVFWIGGLAFFRLLSNDLPPQGLEPAARSPHSKLLTVALASAATLGITGLTMLGANPNFEGWGVYTSLWTQLMLAKHLLFAGMAALTLYVWWKKPADAARRELLETTLWLGVGVLFLTGMLTAIH